MHVVTVSSLYCSLFDGQLPALTAAGLVLEDMVSPSRYIGY